MTDFIAWTFDSHLYSAEGTECYLAYFNWMTCISCIGTVYLVVFFSLQTTLLNHILTAHHGKRIAVIENEVCSY
jgi:hypothetical protein